MSVTINALPFELIADIIALSNKTPADNYAISLTNKTFQAAVKYNALTQSPPRVRVVISMAPSAPARFKRRLNL